MLRPGFKLPPLMFSEEEIEALVLGSRWVASRTDARLALAARNSLAKIAAVIPPALREELDNSSLLVGRGEALAVGDPSLQIIRQAIRAEQKLGITYLDPKGRKTERTIWPFAVGFFDQARVVAAWCEMRMGFRHFRTDRISSVALHRERYPRRRRALLRDWREGEKIPEQ